MAGEKIKGNSGPLRGEITPPGDKSVSHRSLIIGSLASGTTEVNGFLNCEDTISTASAMRKLGAVIDINGSDVKITGKGLSGLSEPDDVIDAGNSGTTTRLLAGLLSAQGFFTAVTGDRYLRARPMKRVVDPLRLMGARITGREGGNKLPLAIEGGSLKGVSYRLPVASAQVKSALLLAGMYAEGETEVIEPEPTRDHTERMLRHFGVKLQKKGNSIKISRQKELEARDISVPADLSSAAFFIVGALISPGSELLIRNVGINPLRTGVIDVLRRMGGNIDITNEREVSGEPVGDILVRASELRGTVIEGETIPKAIDELPVIAAAACFAEGETVIRDARELRVKETDRIKAMTAELFNLGARVTEFDDGMSIKGGAPLAGASCSSWGDHRIAMAVAIAAKRASGETEIDGAECVSVSYPGFFDVLRGFDTD
ncbi:MAG TPA: 3-phosphoshikimate 1-carboxyvinyltransferase [Thermodesulfobacteriota bacterium]|nr:3-phosphoshikimate 1-carboxyvinyltransferase [Thermodesulfobacteriota bacterium]